VKFKKGDTVIVVEEREPNYPCYDVGFIGIVLRYMESGSVQVDFSKYKNRFQCTDGIWHPEEEQLEKVEWVDPSQYRDKGKEYGG